MNPELLNQAAQILELDAKATAGPWEILGGSMTNGIRQVGTKWERVIGCDIDSFPDDSPQTNQRGGVWRFMDAEFIALSRTFAPLAARALIEAADDSEHLHQCRNNIQAVRDLLPQETVEKHVAIAVKETIDKLRATVATLTKERDAFAAGLESMSFLATAERDSLRATVEELQKDKERLDWLEKNGSRAEAMNPVPEPFWNIWHNNDLTNGPTFRSAITAAMTKGEQP